MRNDRLSAIEQWDLGGQAAVANEVARGLKTIASGETSPGRRASPAAPGGTEVSRRTGRRRIVDTASGSAKPPCRRSR